MRRPAFNVVTGVLVTLCALAGLSSLLRPYLPPSSENRLRFSDDDFLRKAAYQPIDWRELGSAAIEEAQLQGKPILLVVGVASSGLATRLDATAFRDQDIARYLSFHFVPIRIDGLQHPEWINAFYPLARIKSEFLPGFQIWALTPKGEIVAFIRRYKADQTIDTASLYKALIETKERYDQMVADGEPPLDNRPQIYDLEALDDQYGYAAVPFEPYRATLEDGIDDTYGGLPRDGIQQLFPNAWRYMAMSGNLGMLRTSLDPLILSPMMDIIDGGFFRVSDGVDYKSIEFSKVATENSEMLATVAIAARLTNDPLYTFTAGNTFRALNDTMRVKGWVAAYQSEDTRGSPRSRRYSFSAARLRDVLSYQERGWANEHLRLDLFENPQMLPFLTRARVVDDPDYRGVIRKLRVSSPSEGALGGIGFLEVEGTVQARMLEAARVLGNREWLKQILPRNVRLHEYVKDGEVTRRYGFGEFVPGYLGDYLAFSDAKLQEYLVTGRAAALEEGLAVLLSGEKRFRGSREGEYRLVEHQLPFANVDMPEIADNFRESCTARLLRLFLAYGRLYENRQEGKTLLGLAYKVSNHFALIAGEGGPAVGGFFCAAAELTDGAYAFCVGSQALDLATALYQKSPTRFVVPVMGGVRPDLAKLPPGIYVADGSVTGPFNVEEAAKRLPPRLRIPTSP